MPKERGTYDGWNAAERNLYLWLLQVPGGTKIFYDDSDQCLFWNHVIPEEKRIVRIMFFCTRRAVERATDLEFLIEFLDHYYKGRKTDVD